MEILKYKSVKKNSFEASFDLKIPKWGNFIIREMGYFVKDNQRWVSYPSKQYESDGKKKYYPYCTFEDIEMNKKFMEQVLLAIDKYLATLPVQEELPLGVQGDVPF
jgi:hypothetical protein